MVGARRDKIILQLEHGMDIANDTDTHTRTCRSDTPKPQRPGVSQRTAVLSQTRPTRPPAAGLPEGRKRKALLKLQQVCSPAARPRVGKCVIAVKHACGFFPSDPQTDTCSPRRVISWQMRLD